MVFVVHGPQLAHAMLSGDCVSPCTNPELSDLVVLFVCLDMVCNAWHVPCHVCRFPARYFDPRTGTRISDWTGLK